MVAFPPVGKLSVAAHLSIITVGVVSACSQKGLWKSSHECIPVEKLSITDNSKDEPGKFQWVAYSFEMF